MINNKKIVLEKIQRAKDNNELYLDLSYQNLSNLPDEIFDLIILRELNLSHNFLNNIDEKKFSKLTGLLNLDLSYNQFNYQMGLPFIFGSNLSIRTLNISNNSFQKLPKELLYLNNIENIILNKNPFQIDIPEEIFDKNIRSLLLYQEEIERSKYVVKLYEGKLIFVGNGDVGKTSLIKKILNKRFKLRVGQELTTKGISINKTHINSKDIDIKYNIEYDANNSVNDDFDENEDKNKYDDFGYPLLEDEYEEDYEDYIDEKYTKIELNIWDFGGQEIYHSTHQFFLTKRSVYVLVWESRKDEITTSFDYWLNIISILGQNSPVLIVQNKYDIRYTEIPKKQLKERFPNIVGFYDASCLTGYGIEEIKDEIETIVKNLPHIGNSVPKAWKDIKQQLKYIQKDYIQYDNFKIICNSYKIINERVDIISEYLHDLGIIIHFKDDFLLNDIVIINPEWGTNAVYSLIDQEEIIRNNGKFSRSDLKKYWKSTYYPINKHGQLLRLMEKFELCFNVSGEYYILPELLPQEISSEDESLKTIKPDLIYLFDYKFLPSGLITRLICKTNFLIYRNLFSKNSIYLHYENSYSLIKQEIFERRIKITLNGESNNELLTLIRNEFNEINSSLNLKSDLDYSESISCNCKECQSSKEPYFFKTSILRKFEDKKKETIECHVSGESINIKNLKKGYLNVGIKISVLNKLLKAIYAVQAQKLSIGKKENDRNSIISEILKSDPNIIVKDQTLHGSSPSGKGPGEIDLKIESLTGETLGIVEAFKLDSFRKNIIETHLNKIFIYDVNGLKENYIFIYSENEKFEEAWKKYMEFVNNHDFIFPIIKEFENISNQIEANSEVFVGKTTHSRNLSETILYHIFINFYIKN